MRPRCVVSPPRSIGPVTSPSDRLTVALADRYRLERELGQGGWPPPHEGRSIHRFMSSGGRLSLLPIALQPQRRKSDRRLAIADREILQHPRMCDAIDAAQRGHGELAERCHVDRRPDVDEEVR